MFEKDGNCDVYIFYWDNVCFIGFVVGCYEIYEMIEMVYF